MLGTPIGSSSYSPLSGQIKMPCIDFYLTYGVLMGYFHVFPHEMGYFHGTKPCIELIWLILDLSLQTGTRQQHGTMWKKSSTKAPAPRIATTWSFFNPRSLKYGPDVAGSGWLKTQTMGRIWRGVGWWVVKFFVFFLGFFSKAMAQKIRIQLFRRVIT